MEEKLDQLLASVDELKKAQESDKVEMVERLDQLEQDVATNQDMSAQRMVKKIRRDRGYEFKRKGNEKQFLFNDELKDRIEAASAHLAKLKPASEPETAALKAATEELQEGAKAIHMRQKLIRIADRSDLGWQVVEAYESDELASDDEDAKRLEKAQKSAEQKDLKNKRKKAAASQRGGKNAYRWRATQPTAPGRSNQHSSQGNFSSMRTTLVPSQGGGPKPRQPGPCFNCLEMGHLKANCPKINRQYPLNNNILVVNNVNVSCNSTQGKGGLFSGDSVGTDKGNSMGIIAQSRDVTVSPSGPDSSSQECVCEERGPSVDIPDVELTTIGRCWELEESTRQKSDVQGRLQANIQFWREILQAPPPIIDCIAEGYKLPLLSFPPQFARPNHKSALENADFVTNSLEELTTNRCIQQIKSQPHICSPLSVVTNRSGKKRLVLNLRFLNQFVLKEKFKYEDIRLVMLMFQKEDYMFTFDLKSGYHHIDIHKEHWKYLGFAWGEGPNTKYYVFCVLPFGLTTAPYLFTKLLRPLVKHWRGQGIRAIVYLDDGIVAAKGESSARGTSNKIQEDLEKAGFVVNIAKCEWEPSQVCTWLGFVINLSEGHIEVPQEKIDDLRSLIKEATQQTVHTARYIASIVGKIISMSIALGPVARLMTRSLYSLINSRKAWCEQLQITAEASKELQFWLTQLTSFNGQNIWHSPSAVRVVYSDASHSGYGGYMVEHGYQVAHGLWTAKEASQSSTWRELRAVRLVLEALIPKLRNERVRWFTDNQNVAHILAVGSRKASLQIEVFAIFAIAMSSQVRIEAEWIPRNLNQTADYISKIIDYDDWSIDRSIFRWLDTKWGPHTVDRFASYYNAQLERFNSRFWNPGSEATDAFTCNWGGENNWLCPPIYLIPRAIQHVKKCTAKATLLIPEWPSAPFWPILFPDGYHADVFVTDKKVIDKSELVIHPGKLGANIFKGIPNTNFLALRLDFESKLAI